MRFAMISTLVAALVSAPVVAAAVGPQMTDQEFVSAARCAAYESLPQFASDAPGAHLQRTRLNAELRRQDEATASTAIAEVRAVYARAIAAEDPVDAAALRSDRNTACGEARALIANRVLAPGDV